jgi:hypothetical protein
MGSISGSIRSAGLERRFRQTWKARITEEMQPLRPIAIIGATLLLALTGACSSSSGSPSARSTVSGGRSQITTTLQAGAASAAVGATAQVTVQALAVSAPGLGAWTFNAEYDPAIVSVTDCQVQGLAACNTHLNDHTVRLAGASATGLTGDVTLMTLTFQCKSTGTSALKIVMDSPKDLLADANVGNPLIIQNPGLRDGSITCS